MPIFGRFTQRAQRAIASAQQAAVKLHQPYVGTEHILLGLRLCSNHLYLHLQGVIVRHGK